MIPGIDPQHLTPTDAPSPFLPNTNIQYAWDSTSIGYFKTCPRLYQYIMIDGWSSHAESIHLRFGIEFHAALELHDRLLAEGNDPTIALHKVYRSIISRAWDWHPDVHDERSARAAKYKNCDTLLQLVYDYITNFADDPAETYIKSDGTPAVELSFRFDLDISPNAALGQPYILCGHLDRVVNFNDSLFVMDRKTTTTTPGAYYFAQYEPHNQMSLYTLAGRVILNAPIRGVIIDAAQIKLEDSNTFARGFTHRTEAQLSEWLTDLQMTFNLAEIYAINNYWPMNDTSCDKFGGCTFRDICRKDPRVRPAFLKTAFNKLPESDRWNPLKSR